MKPNLYYISNAACRLENSGRFLNKNVGFGKKKKKNYSKTGITLALPRVLPALIDTGWDKNNEIGTIDLSRRERYQR